MRCSRARGPRRARPRGCTVMSRCVGFLAHLVRLAEPLGVADALVHAVRRASVNVAATSPSGIQTSPSSRSTRRRRQHEKQPTTSRGSPSARSSAPRCTTSPSSTPTFRTQERVRPLLLPARPRARRPRADPLLPAANTTRFIVLAPSALPLPLSYPASRPVERDEKLEQ